MYIMTKEFDKCVLTDKKLQQREFAIRAICSIIKSQTLHRNSSSTISIPIAASTS